MSDSHDSTHKSVRNPWETDGALQRAATSFNSMRAVGPTMAFSDIETVAVVGAGRIGHGIAEVASLAGYEVTLRDASEELVQSGYDRLERELEQLVARDRIGGSDARAALDRVTPVVDLERAVADAGVVVEAVPESEEVKRAVHEGRDGDASEFEAQAFGHLVDTADAAPPARSRRSRGRRQRPVVRGAVAPDAKTEFIVFNARVIDRLRWCRPANHLCLSSKGPGFKSPTEHCSERRAVTRAKRAPKGFEPR